MKQMGKNKRGLLVAFGAISRVLGDFKSTGGSGVFIDRGSVGTLMLICAREELQSISVDSEREDVIVWIKETDFYRAMDFDEVPADMIAGLMCAQRRLIEAVEVLRARLFFLISGAEFPTNKVEKTDGSRK